MCYGKIDSHVASENESNNVLCFYQAQDMNWKNRYPKEERKLKDIKVDESDPSK